MFSYETKKYWESNGWKVKNLEQSLADLKKNNA